jgi:hypothetical protein
MADVNRLMAAMGLTQKMREAVEAMLSSMHDSLPTVTPEKWNAFEAEMRADPIDRLLLDQVRATMTLSPEEMDAVIAFYESPKGKRIMEKMQLVNGAVDRAMQSWFETKMKNAMTKVMGA